MSGRPPALSRPPCGTESGYTAHRKRRDVPCRACTDAHTAAQRARTHARRDGIVRPPALCGTKAAQHRHRRNGESCGSCGYVHGRGKALQPCGTHAARKRHQRAGEGCEACGYRPGGAAW